MEHFSEASIKVISAQLLADSDQSLHLDVVLMHVFVLQFGDFSRGFGFLGSDSQFPHVAGLDCFLVSLSIEDILKDLNLFLVGLVADLEGGHLQ